jgi:cytochrome b561
MLYQLHKSFGITVLALTLARIGWRLTHSVPPLPATMPVWEHWAARTSHFLFYVLTLAIPLSGWAVASSSSTGVPTIWFGLFEVPHLPVGTDEDAHETFEETHELLGNLMIVLLLIHVAAALKHHFWDRDNVFKRMLPFTHVE